VNFDSNKSIQQQIILATIVEIRMTKLFTDKELDVLSTDSLAVPWSNLESMEKLVFADVTSEDEVEKCD